MSPFPPRPRAAQVKHLNHLAVISSLKVHLIPRALPVQRYCSIKEGILCVNTLPSVHFITYFSRGEEPDFDYLPLIQWMRFALILGVKSRFDFAAVDASAHFSLGRWTALLEGVPVLSCPVPRTSSRNVSNQWSLFLALQTLKSYPSNCGAANLTRVHHRRR